MWEFFNNASIGAFFGAFTAFILVVLTDLRRRYRIKNLITDLVSNNLDLAIKKRESVQSNISHVKENNLVMNAQIMHFPIKSIIDYKFQVLDIFTLDQKRSLDVIIYWMESIDSLLDEATGCATKLIKCIKQNSSNTEKIDLKDEYLRVSNECEINLKYFIELSEYYVSKEYQKILGFSDFI